MENQYDTNGSSALAFAPLPSMEQYIAKATNGAMPTDSTSQVHYLIKLGDVTVRTANYLVETDNAKFTANQNASKIAAKLRLPFVIDSIEKAIEFQKMRGAKAVHHE